MVSQQSVLNIVRGLSGPSKQWLVDKGFLERTPDGPTALQITKAGYNYFASLARGVEKRVQVGVTGREQKARRRSRGP